MREVCGKAGNRACSCAVRGCAPDKTQARPYKVNVVISWLELNGTRQLHQGIFFFPLVSRFSGVHTVAKASEPLKFNKSSVCLILGQLYQCIFALMFLCVQLRYRIALMKDNQAGRLRELVRYR